MTTRNHPLRITLLSLLLLAASVSPSLGQQPTDTTGDPAIMAELNPEQLHEKAAGHLIRIREMAAAIDRYRARLETASAEDSLVLRRQLHNRQVQAGEILHEMVDVLLDLEQQDPQEELRVAVAEMFETITPLLWYRTDRIRQEIDAARSRRSTVDIGLRLALEDRIGDITDILNQLYEYSQQHIEDMRRLGLDTLDARTSLVYRLTDRADELSGRLDLALARMDDLEARLGETPDDVELKVLIVAAEKSRNLNVTSLETVLDLMDAYESRTADYRTQLLGATRDYSSTILDEGVAVGLLGRAWESTTEWLADNGPTFAVRVLLFLGILLAFIVASRVVRRAVEKSLSSSKLNISELLKRMIVNLTANLVMVTGLLIALSQLGISLGPLLAGIGVVGFIIGFALQDTLSNFASGLMILLYRPYDVGDLVDVAGAFGKVSQMSLVSTTVLTLDNQSLVTPNTRIWGDVIKNVTDQDVRRVDMVFGISYSDDIPHAEKVLMDILKNCPLAVDQPEPQVHLHTLGDSSVDFVVRPWAKTDDYWPCYWDVTRAVKMRFDEEGISIPFPQRDVHLYEERLADRPSTSQQPNTTSREQGA